MNLVTKFEDENEVENIRGTEARLRMRERIRSIWKADLVDDEEGEGFT